MSKNLMAVTALAMVVSIAGWHGAVSDEAAPAAGSSSDAPDPVAQSWNAVGALASQARLGLEQARVLSLKAREAYENARAADARAKLGAQAAEAPSARAEKDLVEAERIWSVAGPAFTSSNDLLGEAFQRDVAAGWTLITAKAAAARALEMSDSATARATQDEAARNRAEAIATQAVARLEDASARLVKKQEAIEVAVGLAVQMSGASAATDDDRALAAAMVTAVRRQADEARVAADAAELADSDAAAVLEKAVAAALESAPIAATTQAEQREAASALEAATGAALSAAEARRQAQAAVQARGSERAAAVRVFTDAQERVAQTRAARSEAEAELAAVAELMGQMDRDFPAPEQP